MRPNIARTAVQAMMPPLSGQTSIVDSSAAATTVGFVAAADRQEEMPTAEPPIAAAKGGSKRAVILALLARQEGVTIDDLMAATGWLPHTTRAALSVLRKSGHAIVRTRDADAEASVYRIEASSVAAAA